MSHTQKDNRVFVAAIEIRPLIGCELDPEEFAGAAVRCYIPAHSMEEARSTLLRALTLENMELIEIDFIVGKDDVEWENPDDATAEKLSREAVDEDQVVFGEFRAWSHDNAD